MTDFSYSPSVSSVDKPLRRFNAIPADFTWDELVRLLKSFGFEEQKGPGSRRKFRGEGLPSISLHEPHPSKIVKRYALREVKAILEGEGLI